MSRFHFALADARDDAELRRRMAEDWMPGRISVSLRREPSFFAAARLQGDDVQTIVCRDRVEQRLVGLGTRASSIGFVNGIARRIGYLADLRCEPRYRGGLLLARGYRFLRELHERDPLPFYTTLIYEGNAAALATLCGARAGLPTYRALGRIRTPAIRLDRALATLPLDRCEIAPATPDLLPALIRFLHTRFATRQFAPAYRLQDLAAGRLSGLTAASFLLARRAGRIVGSIAVWDQGSMRQTHVEGYRGLLRALRPVHDLRARLTGVPPLPAPGTRIPYVYFACFAVEEDDATVGRALLRAAYRAARSGHWHYAIAGLHERDPLAALLDDYRAVDAAGRLFLVHYPHAQSMVDALDGRPPYLEAGCL